MVKSSRHNWVPGQTVRVGFFSLLVLAAVPTPGDGQPDAYVPARGESVCKFAPYFGLQKIIRQEAEELVAQGRRIRAAEQASAAGQGCRPARRSRLPDATDGGLTGT